MSKKQPKEPDSKQSQFDQAIVLFGGVQTMLPKELEELGLAGKIEMQEIPGIAPTWKPVNPGDFLLGRVVAEREVEFPSMEMGKPTSRIRRVLVMNTAVPGGFRSVWLGADLRIKLQDPVGKVYQITYQGAVNVGRNANLNAMKSYQVFEIQPKQISEGEQR